MRITVDRCKFASPARYYIEFKSGEKDYFQTLACPENVNEFDYCTVNDQFVPDFSQLDVSILLRKQILDKPLPHDRIVGSWFGNMNGISIINFEAVGESILTGNDFGDVDAGSASISCEKLYVDLGSINPTISKQTKLI
jgi:hypothetical protein